MIGDLADHLASEFGYGRSLGTGHTLLSAAGNSVGSLWDWATGNDRERGPTLWDRAVGNHSVDGVTADELSHLVRMSFIASAGYMTSGEWIGGGFAAFTMMSAGSGLTVSQAKTVSDAK